MKFSLQQFNRLGCISVVNPNGQMFLRFYNKAQIKLHGSAGHTGVVIILEKKSVDDI